jgi:hypothetical protein
VFGAHLRRCRAALLQPVTHVVGALLQPINHGFDALLRQDKAALLQPRNHGFWRPLAPIPDCPLAADKPHGWRPLAPPQGCPLAANKLHHSAHLRRYRTALLRSETSLQTPLSCPINGLPSCNPKAHHPRLQTSCLLAPSCTKFPPIRASRLGQPSCYPNQPTQTSKHRFCAPFLGCPLATQKHLTHGYKPLLSWRPLAPSFRLFVARLGQPSCCPNQPTHTSNKGCKLLSQP